MLLKCTSAAVPEMLGLTIVSMSGRQVASWEAAPPSWQLLDLLEDLPRQPGETVMVHRRVWHGDKELHGEMRLEDLGAGRSAQLTLVLSPRPCVLTASSDGSAKVFCEATAACLLTLLGHGDEVCSVAACSGQRLITASHDGTARLWCAYSGECVLTLTCDGPVHQACSGGETVLTASADRTARIFSAATGACLVTMQHESGVRAAAFSPDGKRLVTLEGNGHANLWSLAGEKLAGWSAGGISAAFSPHGERVLTACEGCAKVWCCASGELMQRLEVGGGTLLSAAYAPDGDKVLVALGGHYGMVRLLCCASGKVLLTLREQGACSAVLSADSKRVLTAGLDAALWCAETGERLQAFDGHSEPVLAVQFAC